MNEDQRIDVCANCLHCVADENNEQVCAINYDMHARRCRVFAPKHDDIAERYAKSIIADSISTPLTWVGISLVVFAIFCAILAGFENAVENIWGNPFVWALITTGVLCIIVAAILHNALRLRHNTISQELRKELEAEVRQKALPRLLTRNAIKDFLTQRGLSPEPIDGNEGFNFTSHDTYYRLLYDGERDLTIRYGCELDENDAKIAQKIINTYDGDVFGAFRKVYEFTKDGEVKYALMCEIDFFVEYVDHFERVFPRYLHSVELAVNNLFVSLNRYEREEQNDDNSRGDIYNPEYRLIPYMLQGVKDDHLLPDALVDEEWIRSEIQTRCSSNECKEEWNSFKINRVNKFGDYKLIIYQFPEPKVAPEAKYGAVLLNTNTLDSNYYTLEMSVEDRWYYGGVSEDRHLNYGEAESADLDHFIEWIFSNDKQIEASTDYNKG
ncbi:MAG: hypothetical protein IKA04_01770 [Alistipes sp.]|nr:hypothetical protein [Alistipes sp.]